MKQFFLLLVLALFFTNTYAKTLTYNEVPAIVRAAFYKAHPTNYDVSWTQHENNYKVEYDINKVDISNVYEVSGKLVNTETDIEIATLSNIILAYVKTNYNQLSVNEAFKIKDNDGVITFKTEINGKCLMFDASGNFIKEIKK